MHAIIMAGGSGTRFWPLSRHRRPKQMLTLFGDEPMISQTVSRLHPVVMPHEAVIVTAEHLVEDVLSCVTGITAENVIAEPVGRNTAPCIALATELISQRSDEPDPVIGVFAADHHVTDAAAFRKAIECAGQAARNHDAIITLGVQPTGPETGYGYIQASASASPSSEVIRFVEKPDADTARRYLEKGGYFWNAGLFFFRASVMRAELKRQLPEMAETVAQIAAAPAAQFNRRLRELFPRLQSISIDYGVMEGAHSVRMVPVDCGWSDVGHFGALSDLMQTDDNGNLSQGEVVLHNTRGTVVINEQSGHVVAVVGNDDMVVVHTEDATLVMPRQMAQDVRKIVEALRESQRDDVL